LQKVLKGGGPPELSFKTETRAYPTDWSGDGRLLVYVTSREGLHDIWTLSVSERTAAPLLVAPFNEYSPRISPDGRWFTYASDESGHEEVYVQSFPKLGSKVLVSVGGGAQPIWRGDGRELYYLSPGGKLMAVPVRLGAEFRAGAPEPLFDARVRTTAWDTAQYD